MTFPSTVMPVRAEIQRSDTSAWVDVTGDVFGSPRGGVSFTRGRQDEGGQGEPGLCRFQINNRNGDYAPRNPTGTYYGAIGRNTPVRFSVQAKTNYLDLKGNTGSHATAPDSAGLSIVGDIEITAELELDSWRNFTRIMQKWTTTANQRSYVIEVDGDGFIRFFWSTTGADEPFLFSDTPVPFVVGKHAIKVTFDVNNGAGGKTATFYYGDTATGSFTQLGSAVTETGTTSIFDSTSLLYAWTSDPSKYHRLIVKQGIAGTTRADIDFTAQVAADTSFSDGTNTWTVNGDAEISDRDWRYQGDITSWPTRWDKSNTDRYVDVSSNGILRRLLQGNQLPSTVYRATIGVSPLEYWPMEDGSQATELGSATGGRPMTITGVRPSLATFSGFNCSSPIPTLDINTILRGAVRSHTATGFSQIRGLVAFPEAGLTNDVEINSINYTGTAAGWQIRYATGGSFTIRAFDDVGTSLLTDGPWAFDIDGKEVLLSLELTQTGANIDWDVAVWEVEAEAAGLVASGTLAGRTIGRATRVEWNTNGGADGLSIGHTTVQTEVTSIFDRGDELKAYDAETAGDRISRLCTENSIECRVAGDSADSEALGPQFPRTLIDLLREAAVTDGGALYEARHFRGLVYRPRTAMYSQVPTAEVVYGTDGITVMEPIEDDQLTVNDVTVRQAQGTFYHLEEDTGNLTPALIGSYSQDVSVSVSDPLALPDQAGWRLHLGTWDAARFPHVEFTFGNPGIYNDVALWEDLSELECGLRLLIAGPPVENLPPDDISLLVQGMTETLGNFERTLAVNASPEDPWHVGIADDDGAAGFVSRADTDGSELNGAHNSSTTSLSVEQSADAAAAGAPLWTTDAAELPFDIMVAGERMTVTVISGTTSPQTFTVTRHVNGITKSHTDGTDVRLAEPTYRGI